MKILLHIDRKDYDLSLPRLVRYSPNSIITKGEKIALVYSEKHKFYAFPGGGIEENETIIDALIRETKEETGLIIKPASIVEFGETVEIRKDRYSEGIYERHDCFYFCDVEEEKAEPCLTGNEIESGIHLSFVSIEKAIEVNEIHMKKGFSWTEIPTYILKLLWAKQTGKCD